MDHQVVVVETSAVTGSKAPKRIISIPAKHYPKIQKYRIKISGSGSGCLNATDRSYASSFGRDSDFGSASGTMKVNQFSKISESRTLAFQNVDFEFDDEGILPVPVDKFNE